MNPGKLVNILKAASNPAKAQVMVAKVGRRLLDEKGTIDQQANAAWLEATAVSPEVFLHSFPPELVSEAKEFASTLEIHAQHVLSKIPHFLGGGGATELLYALTRLVKPKTVVETGVAAGFSSAAFLAALSKNGAGSLYSSDFPYFRLPNPEQYIGVVVEQGLRANWQLYLEGDEKNLPNICRSIESIDLVHYDSDKSYRGRARALALITPLMTQKAILVMDDIQDNCYFHDLVTHRLASQRPYRVIRYPDKFVGVLGDISD